MGQSRYRPPSSGHSLVAYENVPGEDAFLLQSLQPFQIPCRMAACGLCLNGDLLHEYEIDLESGKTPPVAEWGDVELWS